MSPERESPAALSSRDVAKILAICSRAVLVGGQALALWADHFRVKPPELLASGVTADADFIGDGIATRGERCGPPMRSRSRPPLPGGLG
jgi:hypothetical protein